MFQIADEVEWALFFISVAVIIFYLQKKDKNFFSLKKKRTYATICLVSLFIFLKILSDIFTKGTITKLDFLVSENIISIWNPLIIKIILFITQVFNVGAIVLLIFITLFFIKVKKMERAVLIILGSAIAYFSETILKNLIKITRPQESLIKLFGYGFPSGHATIAAASLSLLIYCFYDLIKNKNKKLLFILICIFLILFVGFTRIYLSVHKVSDVLAGFALGFFISGLLILLFKAIKKDIVCYPKISS